MAVIYLLFQKGPILISSSSCFNQNELLRHDTFKHAETGIRAVGVLQNLLLIIQRAENLPGVVFLSSLFSEHLFRPKSAGSGCDWSLSCL